MSTVLIIELYDKKHRNQQGKMNEIVGKGGVNVTLDKNMSPTHGTRALSPTQNNGYNNKQRSGPRKLTSYFLRLGLV